MTDNLSKVVKVFSFISELEVNKAKSFVAGINSIEEKVNALANQFGLSIGSWQSQILKILGHGGGEN